MALNLWCNHIGPLAFSQYHDLPIGSRKKNPKFSGEDTQDPEEHILAMTAVSGILGIQDKDVFVRIFVDILIKKEAKWFRGLEKGCITR